MYRSALAAILLPAAASAATPAQLCEAAKLKAASAFSQCRGKADAAYAGSAKGPTDTAKRDALYTKCNDALVRGYGAAEVRYGAYCPTTGDVDAVRTYLTQCAQDVGGATQPGGVGVPDYVADLAACKGDLTTALAGTATAGNVLSGKTFTSAAGIGASGTMPNRGAVTITPGATSQAIAAGYHNGSGTVGPATAGNFLLRTGQTTAYGLGSDGDLQKGAVQSFTDNGDGTVTDDRTGLMWEKKSDNGDIHDKDTTYTWGQNVSPYAMNGTMVTTFLAALNTPPCLTGYCDWRVPNITELLSLVNYETVGPATFSAFNTACTAGCAVTACSCTASNGYWSSSTSQYSPGFPWFVGFYTGYADASVYYGKAYEFPVRAVRGGS